MNDKTGQESSANKKANEKSKAKDMVKKQDVSSKNPVKNANQGGSKLLGIISLIGLLLLAAVVIFFVQKGKQELAEMRQSEAKEAATLEDVNKQLQLLKKEDDTQLKTISQLLDNQQTLEDSLGAIHKEKPDSNLDWSLMEVEHLIIIAMHRLLLERDVKTAITALESADRRLKDIANPALIPIREQIASDLNALKGVNAVDTTGLSLFLSDLISRAESLKLKKQMILVKEDETQAAADVGEQSSWKDLPGMIWKELKSLVVIKHKDDDGTAFLLPEEEYYLYQNLRLQLENARLSVLNLDSENLKSSIDIITSWLNRHFDTNETAVGNVLETLVQMKTIDLKPDLPDITSSLETLRAFMKDNDVEITKISE